jgi:iron complex transport system permease protein
MAAVLTVGAGVGSTGFDSLLQAQRPGGLADRVGHPAAAHAGRLARRRAAGAGGAVAQGLFRNPLADPFLLGSASGAALGWRWPGAVWGVTGLRHCWVAPVLGLTGAAFIGAVGACCWPGAGAGACSTRCGCCWPA